MVTTSKRFFKNRWIEKISVIRNEGLHYSERVSSLDVKMYTHEIVSYNVQTRFIINLLGLNKHLILL